MANNEPIKPFPDGSYKSEQILKGAMQVFLQHGYAGTSMDRVAIEAGVSKHTIYNHFQSKEGLFAALFERLVLRHFRVEFGCELPAAGPPEKVLRRLAEIFLARMDDSEYIAFVRLLFAESGRFPELAQLYMQEVVNKGNEALTCYLKNHVDLQVVAPEMATQIFWGSLLSFILTQEVLHAKQTIPLQREKLVDTLIQMILGDRK